MLSIQDKAAFSALAGQLSPENLCCDGELRGRALQTKANRLRREWAALEKRVGRKVTEDETWGWHRELDQYHREELARKMALRPQHPLLKQANEHVWRREGGAVYEGSAQRQSAYYVQNFGGDGQPFVLFSEFAQRLHRREKLGEYPTLDAAVEAGEAFLLTVTRSAYQQHTQYLPENVERELTRLPDDLRARALVS